MAVAPSGCCPEPRTVPARRWRLLKRKARRGDPLLALNPQSPGEAYLTSTVTGVEAMRDWVSSTWLLMVSSWPLMSPIWVWMASIWL